MKAAFFAGVAFLAVPTGAGAQALDGSAEAVESSGMAQEVPAGKSASADQASENDAVGLADIVVTAQRRSESLQRAAVAVSAVTGDTLTSARVTQPANLSSLVPALQTAPASGSYPLFYLRGVGTFAATILNDPAIAFNVNQVYVGRPSGTTGYFFDVDRVEVLKGPQGTLYGRNATGGAINIITRKPVLGSLSGYASFDYGNYDSLNAEAAVNVPLGQDAALRVAGTYVRHDPYMKDGTDDQNEGGGRISFYAEPSDNFTVQIVADYFRQRGNGGGATPTQLGVKGRYGNLSPEAAAFVATQPDFILGRTEPALTSFCPGTKAQPCTFLQNERWGISGIFELSTSIGTLTAIPAFIESKVHYLSAQQYAFIGPDETNTQTSLELRLTSDDDKPLRYLAGFFYYHEEGNNPEYINTIASSKSVLSQRQRLEALAGFGRLTWAVTPDFRLTGGVRYTTENRRLALSGNTTEQICVAGFPNCPTAVPYPVYPLLDVPEPNYIPGPTGTISADRDIPAQNKRLKSNKFTYRLAADWDITPTHLLYASFETGFKAGGFFTTIDEGTYQPENIKAFTIGSKNRFFDNRLQINLEGFYWKYSDQQVTHVAPDSGGVIRLITENVAKADIKGFEIDARLRLFRNTEIDADVQYLDSKYKDFVFTLPNTNGGMGNGTGCPNNSTTAASYIVNCSGFTPPFSPKWTINLGLQQTVPLEALGKLVISLRTHYQSRTLTGYEFVAVEEQSAYWKSDISLTYTDAKDHFSVTGYVNNVTDRTIIGYTFPAVGSTFHVSTIQPPRTYGVRVGYKF